MRPKRTGIDVSGIDVSVIAVSGVDVSKALSKSLVLNLLDIKILHDRILKY